MSVKFVSPLGLPIAYSNQSAPSLAQIYFNATDKKVKVYKSSGWADLGGSSSGSSGKPGMVTSWAGSHDNVPSGWILCDGAAISRATYADLFTAIGTSFGTGNGSTTFNIPNYIDYWLVGAPSSLTTAPNPSGLPASWVVASGSDFYTSFSHSTNGAHSSHSTSLTSAGAHTHTGGHTHSITSATSGSATEASHAVSGVFGSGGSAHTHSSTSSGPSTTASRTPSGTLVASATHTHVVSFASAATGTTHVALSGDPVSYAGTTAHTAHTHTGASATSDSQGATTAANAAHTHTLSSIASSGGHAHATHNPKRQKMYYIIKT